MTKSLLSDFYFLSSLFLSPFHPIPFTCVRARWKDKREGYSIGKEKEREKMVGALVNEEKEKIPSQNTCTHVRESERGGEGEKDFSPPHEHASACEKKGEGVHPHT